MTTKNTISHSFVILNESEYIESMIDIIKDINLTINENESDINLGYFTVYGNSEDIEYLKDYLNGEYI